MDPVMERRTFMAMLTGGIVVSPLAAEAQQAGKVYRVGFLGNSSAALEANLVGPFREGLRELGYVEGRNIVIEYRWAEGKYERFPALIAELAALNVDVIVTAGTPAALAVKRTTPSIPLVMAAVGDPIGVGLVASLARPGGNVTGLSAMRRGLPLRCWESRRSSLASGSRKSFQPRSRPLSESGLARSWCWRIASSCTTARASWTSGPNTACPGCIRTGSSSRREV